MNEYGVDSLQLSAGQLITQAQIDLISFLILKAGVYSSLPSDVNTSRFWNQTFTTFQYVQPSIRLMKDSGKPTGVFFFSYAWSYAAAEYEARLACDAMDQWTEHCDWPIFIDWESTGRYSPAGAQGAYEALVTAGITPTASIGHDVVTAWMTVLRQRGYIPGLYTGGDLGRNLFGESWIQQKRQEGLYYWEAAYNNTGPMQACDIWQKSDRGDLLGVRVDDDYVRDDRIWNIGPGPGPSSGIPIWLLLKIAERNRGDKRGCTILL